jgi:hypothetical protein
VQARNLTTLLRSNGSRVRVSSAAELGEGISSGSRAIKSVAAGPGASSGETAEETVVPFTFTAVTPFGWRGYVASGVGRLQAGNSSIISDSTCENHSEFMHNTLA